MPQTVTSDFGGAFAGRKVLLTGHTGFKGGWLSMWLARLGADVTGVALPPEPGPSFFEAAGIARLMDSRIADITDAARLDDVVGPLDAEILVHMAAQPLVRESYGSPAETFATNVMGTVNVLEVARSMPSLRAIVVVTSDKCYDNKEWLWGYRENDALGGADPYSASKGCQDLVSQSYRRSFFDVSGGPRLATVRAGNVFGGGDWGGDRLVPDIVRAATDGRAVQIRNPGSVRPWQHVLEPLAGYLAVAAGLFEHGAAYEGAWNFGPEAAGTVPVRRLTEEISRAWGPDGPQIVYGEGPAPADGLHEAGLLRLDSTKAQTRLGWQPQLSLREAVAMTVHWYRRHAAGDEMAALSEAQITLYGERMDAGGSPPAPVAVLPGGGRRSQDCAAASVTEPGHSNGT